MFFKKIIRFVYERIRKFNYNFAYFDLFLTIFQVLRHFFLNSKHFKMYSGDLFIINLEFLLKKVQTCFFITFLLIAKDKSDFQLKNKIRKKNH